MRYNRETAIKHKNAHLAEREANRANRDYCQHGTYTGGAMEDFLCGWCEDGHEISTLIAYEIGIAKAKTERHEELASLVALILETSTAGLALRKIRDLLEKEGIGKD